MKAICLLMLLVFLSVEAVVTPTSQEAQRREAPSAVLQVPVAPIQSEYGAPNRRVPQQGIRQNRIHAMKRLIAAVRNSGYASQGRVVNRPHPIPVQQPQGNYGPPHVAGGSSSHGSLASFMHNHSPDVRCDGWIPIPGPSDGQGYHSGGGSASHVQSIDSSYGPPRHGSGNGANIITQIITVPDISYGAPAPQIQPPSDSYGPPSHGNSGNGGHQSFGSESHGHGISGGSLSGGHQSFGSAGHGHSISGGLSGGHQSFGSAGHGHSISGGSSSGGHHSFGSSNHGHSSSHGGGSGAQDSYGPPPPPSDSYGPPNHGGSGFSSGSGGHGPAPVHESHSSGHSSGHSSVSSVQSIETHFGGPQPIGHATYGPPKPQPLPQQPDITYGTPVIALPESSYGPPPSGNVHHEAHEEIRGSSHGGDIQTIHNIGQQQLPAIDSGSLFNSAIGLVTSSLGVSAGHNEVVPSHAIHESHTSEVASSYNSGDSYSAPPLDSYAPGAYAPSHLKPRPGPGPAPHPRPLPPPPSNSYLPQRPQPRPQYVPPVPIKINRPHPPQFRPQQFNSHAQSIAHGYSSGQSHSQSLHAPAPIRQQPRYPLPHRAPVPHGLFQSVGQHVQALDNGHRNQNLGNTYVPPPVSEVPIPPMKLSVPNHGPVQPFNSNHQSHSHQSHSSGSASSSSGYSFQNQQLQNVHIIHDCGKGPQLSNSYGTPLAAPLTSYQIPSHLQSSGNSGYDIPNVALEVPQHNSIDFNSPSNSYGPPASGPASIDAIDVIGLESSPRANAVSSTDEHNVVAAASEYSVNSETLPGLETGLSGSGLNFISAQKSQSIEVPKEAQLGSYHLQLITSSSEQNSNTIDAPNHQQILADGLLQSILSAVEQKPAHTIPQVSEDHQTDHSEVQVFLKSPEGQEVLADKHASIDEHSSS
ncbi:CLUMA_CG018780, isoform A [Clunio marinus]|uniref:CLUMA_CG018780, isoform A n=1 Tax=Clunio marinus TaxID=568069 RepID=A0A1J1J028_9DIPT|nr:CLUMA_CG018780, isoform A [Clunio marinus]